MQQTRSPDAAATAASPPGHALATPRPLRDVFRQLQQLPVNDRQEPDFESVQRSALERLAHNADTSMRAIHLGVGALGHLLARSAAEIEDGAVPAECVAHLGFLMAELGDLAAECLWLASQSRSALKNSGRQSTHANSP